VRSYGLAVWYTFQGKYGEVHAAANMARKHEECVFYKVYCNAERILVLGTAGSIICDKILPLVATMYEALIDTVTIFEHQRSG